MDSIEWSRSVFRAWQSGDIKAARKLLVELHGMLAALRAVYDRPPSADLIGAALDKIEVAGATAVDAVGREYPHDPKFAGDAAHQSQNAAFVRSTRFHEAVRALEEFTELRPDAAVEALPPAAMRAADLYRLCVGALDATTRRPDDVLGELRRRLRNRESLPVAVEVWLAEHGRELPATESFRRYLRAAGISASGSPVKRRPKRKHPGELPRSAVSHRDTDHSRT